MRLIDADELRREFIIGHDLVGAKYVDLAPTIEPNLVINPDEVERGDVTMIGQEIVVMHYDDYMEMMLKSAAVDDGSWERFAAEPCEDAISREVAIEQIVNTPTSNQDKGQDYLEGSATRQNEIIDILKSVTSVAPSRPSGEWIPCSEWLPDKPYGCLVTVWDGTPTGEGDDFENLLPYFVGWDGEQWNDGDGEQCPFEVIAWMPLPEPYKESE